MSEDWQAELAGRRSALLKLLERHDCDAGLIFGSHGHGEHFRYLTGFEPVLGDMWVVIRGDGEFACVLDFAWQLEEARRRSGIDEWHGQLNAAELVAGLLADRSPPRLGIAGLHRLPVTSWDTVRGRLDELEAVDIGPELAARRRKKSPLEVGALREAARITDAALDYARGEVWPGVSERELAARVGHALGPDWSFQPCVISGVDDPIPIREPTERRLEAGDTVMVDIGASSSGYQADATRTFVLGTTSKEQARVWEAVQRGYEAALEKVRPGTPCVALQKAASEAVQELGYSLVHRIGHGIGLSTSFEWPDLENEQAPLEPGVTICIEPGIAVPGAGVMKLEDDLLITEDGCEVLTQSDRGLEVSA